MEIDWKLIFLCVHAKSLTKQSQFTLSFFLLESPEKNASQHTHINTIGVHAHSLNEIEVADWVFL